MLKIIELREKYIEYTMYVRSSLHLCSKHCFALVNI
jgi:hypothetical protein